MAKYDFNVALLNEHNEPVKRVVYDRTKQKPDAHGNLISPVKMDEDGSAVTETVKIADSIIPALNHVYEGDANLPADERILRGKLIRKLADKTKGSLKNYSPEELVMIKNYVGKAGGNPLLLDQLDQIISGTGEESTGGEGQAAA